MNAHIKASSFWVWLVSPFTHAEEGYTYTGYASQEWELYGAHRKSSTDYLERDHQGFRLFLRTQGNWAQAPFSTINLPLSPYPFQLGVVFICQSL